MADKCKECGCVCKQCNKDEQKHNDMHLHVEIENLRQRLLERDNHIVTMETQFLNEADKFPNGELASLKEEILIWQDKFARLYEAHKRVQKVNQNLEDKLLRIVDKCETEKGAFTKDIATLSHRLADANYTIHRLTQDNENYRNDVNLAIQLLQCKPTNFIGQKYESLPPEVQAKVKTYVAQKTRINETPNTEVKCITVPISTFPPTAMVYNVAKPVVEKQDANSDDESKPPIDVVSAAIMAKVLEDKEKERIFARHCNTCTCHRSVLKVDTETQTVLEQDESRLSTTKDYFSKFNRNELKNAKNNKEPSQSDVREVSLNFSKGYSHSSDLNAKRATFYSANEVEESKYINDENAKLSNRYSSNTTNYLNLKNISSKHESASNEANINDKFKSMNQEDRNVMINSLNHCKKSISEKKSSKETKNFDDQAKIDMINERLWKSSWINSKALLNAKDNEVQLDVINERVWRNSSSSSIRSMEKPARLTVIEVKSSDDLTNQNEKTQTEPATSPSFSGESMLISSSDPSSLSSDVVSNPTICKSAKPERITGPRNCLMRVTPGSKNILLDNVGVYQTVLYTTGCSRPSTALVHVAKSSRSGRSASISSEENVPCTVHDNTHLQRVAEWVDTVSSDCDSHVAQPLDTSSEDPLLNANFKTSKLHNNLAAQEQREDQRDLMTFEGSSDEEHKLATDLIYQTNISNEIEETYMKLAASLGTTSPNPIDIDLMTIEKYRKEQKRSYRNSQAKLQSKS